VGMVAMAANQFPRQLVERAATDDDEDEIKKRENVPRRPDDQASSHEFRGHEMRLDASGQD
jgi:hypothetical protein